MLGTCTINGKEPTIVGERCIGFALVQFYEGREIVDQVNVAYLRFGELWHRLYFETGTIFWRPSSEPDAGQNTELTWGAVLNDLSAAPGIVGHVVESYSYSASVSGDVEVKFAFAGGRCLKFLYDSNADATRLDG